MLTVFNVAVAADPLKVIVLDSPQLSNATFTELVAAVGATEKFASTDVSFAVVVTKKVCNIVSECNLI